MSGDVEALRGALESIRAHMSWARPDSWKVAYAKDRAEAALSRVPADGEIQWTGDNLEAVVAFCSPVKAFKTVDGVCVQRPEGEQWVHRGEWVVRRDGKLSIWKRRPVPADGERPADAWRYRVRGTTRWKYTEDTTKVERLRKHVDDDGGRLVNERIPTWEIEALAASS